MLDAGTLRFSVLLENPAVTDDTDGGFTESWTPLRPDRVPAAIESATVARMERVAPGTVVSTATHLVTMRYHPDVTTRTRITFGTRIFQVLGVVNVDERNIVTRAICAEVVT